MTLHAADVRVCCSAATAAQQRDLVGDFSNSEIDCEAKRKVKKEVKEG